MSLIKLTKHEVYAYIVDNLKWFRAWPMQPESDNLRYRTCYDIGQFINGELKNKYECADPPFIKLSGATMSALVYDGVMEREYYENLRCYRYRPILPIDEDYKLNER